MGSHRLLPWSTCDASHQHDQPLKWEQVTKFLHHHYSHLWQQSHRTNITLNVLNLQYILLWRVIKDSLHNSSWVHRHGIRATMPLPWSVLYPKLITQSFFLSTGTTWDLQFCWDPDHQEYQPMGRGQLWQSDPGNQQQTYGSFQDPTQ